MNENIELSQEAIALGTRKLNKNKVIRNEVISKLYNIISIRI